MANVTYTVVKGDTLSEIAVRYNTTVNALVSLNHIKDPDYIVVGQVLIISGTANKVKTNKTSKAVIELFGLQSNTDRTMYATWRWDKNNTKEYLVMWYYDTGDGVWFIGSDASTTDKQSIYTAPNNAVKVKFKVKPVSTTRTVNKKETKYWTASWSTEKKYNFKDNPPKTPPVPLVEIVDYQLTATLNNLDVNAKQIEFQVVKDNDKVLSTGKSKIVLSSVSYKCKVTAGSLYKVRARSVRDKDYSDWSEYSDNIETIPSASKGINELKALSDTSIFIDWKVVSNAKSYDIEYTTNKMYFDSSSEVKSTSVEAPTNHAEITGLEAGQEWFFRVRTVNKQGKSAWTAIKSIVLGKKPSAPTTWSSTTTANVGDKVTLYWLHNSEDGSSETYAEIELNINGTVTTDTIKKSTNEDEKDKTSFKEMETNGYVEGASIKWRVRTKGILNEYSDWSIERTIDIYAPPVLELDVTDSNGNLLNTLTSYPFYIRGIAGPESQTPTGYHISIRAEDSYETVDNMGNFKMVSAGDEVYSKYFDTSEDLYLELSVNSLTLENNITYNVVGTVSMNSGLTATTTISFTVAFGEEDEYEPDAEIAIDKDNLVAYIRPYAWRDIDDSDINTEHESTILNGIVIDCDVLRVREEANFNSNVLCIIDKNTSVLILDENSSDTFYYIRTESGIEGYCMKQYIRIEEAENRLIVNDGIFLSVYRRNYDGTFTEIAVDIDGSSNTFVTDPHPSLDLARYRVVSKSKATGNISYCDIPGYPVEEPSIVIQWDEIWTPFDTDNEDELERSVWSGSILKLPYNVDISDKGKLDVVLVEYIGRRHPVSYYGTQVGETSSWNVVIPKDDVETLYALRRLKNWMGNVYVREPSGSGYWASIEVSFNIKHLDVTIPVSLSVTRVEGGV